MGFDVDAINSVQFSNHTGYKHFAGQVLTDKDLGQLAENLSLNNLDFYSHLLTGYVGSPSFLNRIAELIRHLRQVNPNLIYGTPLSRTVSKMPRKYITENFSLRSSDGRQWQNVRSCGIASHL